MAITELAQHPPCVDSACEHTADRSAAELDVLIEQLRKDEAIADANTLLHGLTYFGGAAGVGGLTNFVSSIGTFGLISVSVYSSRPLTQP
jgi:hypothetical protein